MMRRTPQARREIPDPGDRGLPRYSQRALPAYRFVPGVHPHPTRDPRGHSYEAVPVMHRHRPWQPKEWRELEAWRYGVDLFNRFYFWEAHEAWEALWASTPRDGLPALFVQGLIQITAAMLKVHQGVVGGGLTLSEEGLQKLRRVAATEPETMGLNVRRLVQDFGKYFRPIERGALPELGPEVPALVLTTGNTSRASEGGDGG